MDYAEVSKHITTESCWVILYGTVYDVTSFLPHHPGGAKIILQLAGRDATSQYDPVHPPGTLETSLESTADLGPVDQSTLPPTSQAPSSNNSTATPSTQSASQDVRPDPSTLLNLSEFEHHAQRLLSPNAWAYYYSGADDLFSKEYNHLIYSKILLRPRVFVDCTICDTSTTLLARHPSFHDGAKARRKSPIRVQVPFYIAPAAMARLAHSEGEYGMAKAASKHGAMQIISNNASMTPEQITKDASDGQVFGWQLYVQTDRKKSENMLRRVNKIESIKFICLTLDAPVPGKREDDERQKNVGAELPVRSAIVEATASGVSAAKDGDFETKGKDEKEAKGGLGKFLFAGTAADLTWKNTLPWLAKHTDLPVVLKGIQTHEDAYMAMQYAPQVAGIILSNHGGRAADTAPSAIHTLLEIRKYCPEVFSRIDVWVDGGIKRGTDVVKALALGAKAVGLGRAPLYGLGVAGPEGVHRVLTIVKEEMETAMRLLGCERIEQLGSKHVNARAAEAEIYNGPAGLEKLGMWVSSKL